MAWIPLVDAAKRYGVSASTIRRWAKKGRLEKKPGGMGDPKSYVDEDVVRQLTQRPK